ncbi:mandelate racemase [Afipia sp. Root123D2]|uniref:YncE family protein n=1 Tax=Afipia sp. Root123D2 TaxID=1736436 RepID=UPI0006F669C1|nr:YncE family protein [Afipia sp. Root123D2]KQW23385.1 mandelate racemase [Afipia sp. Root123D2]
MFYQVPHKCALVLALVLLTPVVATAQIAVSANDGKSALNDGKPEVRNPLAPDTVFVIDLDQTPPKIVGEVKAPASAVGPPTSVAVAKDESFALVTGAMKIDPADPKKAVADNKLSVIDLKAEPPAVSATLEAGAGAAGVSISPAGDLALVANRAEGTVSIFKISGKTLTPAGKIDFGEPKSGPCAVAFTPDGKLAFVTRDGDHKVSVLKIDGDKVEYTKRDVAAGLRPYGISMSPKGDVALVADLGLNNGNGDADTVSIIDVQAKPPRLIDTVTVGTTPEGMTLSRDGQYLALAVMNGSNKAKAAPIYNDHGLLKIYRLKNKRLTFVTQADVGHWCQGVTFNKDNKKVLVQCMIENEIQVFSFNGKSLKRTGAIKAAGPAGIRIADK